MMRHLRSACFFAFLVVWTLLLAPAIPWLAWRKDAALTRRVSRLWSRGLLGALRVIVGLGWREIGREHRPGGPALYVSNHQSAWETLAFSVLIRTSPSC